jgi:DNA-binding transcriptional regulator YiaG
MARSAEYRIWCGMLSRCNKPNNKGYRRYGGRGIKVHATWQGPGGFERFLAHVGRRPSPQHSIDRINNDGNYEPGNVRWATATQQMRNSSINHILEWDGLALPVSAWAERLGMNVEALRCRVFWGWSTERILTTPIATDPAQRARTRRSARLTQAQVDEIRVTLGVSLSTLAARYGVNKTTISRIKLGKSWA